MTDKMMNLRALVEKTELVLETSMPSEVAEWGMVLATLPSKTTSDFNGRY